MLHRLRSMVERPGRDRLSGTVEVDETYTGGEERGLAGRAKAKAALDCVAVEVDLPRGFGQCRMQTIPDASAVTLRAFLAAMPGGPGLRVPASWLTRPCWRKYGPPMRTWTATRGAAYLRLSDSRGPADRAQARPSVQATRQSYRAGIQARMPVFLLRGQLLISPMR